MKHISPHAFLPTSQRLLAILQLCLSFSLVCWYAAQPFMGEYFSLRSRSLLYEYAMGKPHQTDKQQRQAVRFQALPDADKQWILQDYQAIQDYAARPTGMKLSQGMHTLFVKLPPFEVAWLVFSIVISIMLLLKTEGARQAVWLLPLIAFAYAVDNHVNGLKARPSPDVFLFPSEKIVVEDYLQQPLSASLLEQKEQLQKGWELYLVQNWLPKEYVGQEQIEEAEFHFTLARLKHLQEYPVWSTSFHEQANSSLLICYMIWNIFFAWKMSIPILGRHLPGNSKATL